MGLSLYSATIPSYLQIVPAIGELLGKAEAHCQQQGIAPDAIIQARLADDMLPFCNQVKYVAMHSLGAINGVRKGVYTPDLTPPPATFAALKALIAETLTALNAVTAAEVDGFMGRDMAFVFGEHRIAFTAENFLLSFSQPNFYFHATTAYDLLRWKGVKIGKRDFVGKLRSK